MNSWIDHIKSQLLSKGISEAAIIGVDGSVWAKSREFSATAAELKAFISKYDSDEFSENGIMMGGMKYFYLSRDHGVVRAKKGQNGFHAMKLKQLYIIALYDVINCPPPEAAITVENYGNYLSKSGY